MSEVAAADKQWFGHPRGLATCFLTEMWERFSYYGMRALLTLYMVGSVVKPGLGFDVKKAAQIYALYTACVYFSGIPGGWIADRFIGHKRAVFVGGCIIALGHFSMAVPRITFFYLGLGLIIIGTGMLKPNVSTIVGSLYAPDDKRRDAGFSTFYMGINLGATLAPFVTTPLAQGFKIGRFSWSGNWHYGFAAAGVGMVIGLIQYAYGQKYLVVRSEGKGATTPTLAEPAVAKEPFSAADWGRIAAAVVLSCFALLFWAGFEQAGSSLTLFADRATRLSIFGVTYPSGLFQFVEPGFVIIFSPIFALLWLRLGGHEPSSPVKFTLGLIFLSLSFALVVPAAHMFEKSGGRVSPWWLVGLYFLQMIGELCLSPVGLSMITKLSPGRIVGVMMGVWFAATGLGNYVAGWVAGQLENRPFSEVFRDASFIVAGAAVVLILLIPPIKRMMGGVK
ncbi:MAG TPA: peptide MFS transporter [Thermoanaerobaculia bacterium]|nr:peptide MFS transporter [Thermoanaerobaculia bacterium]